jgi:hypothetical protein
VVEHACPKAGVLAEFHLRWNQLGIGPSSPAGHGEDCFLDLCLGEIAELFRLNMRHVGQFVGRNHAVDNGRAVGLSALSMASRNSPGCWP